VAVRHKIQKRIVVGLCTAAYMVSTMKRLSDALRGSNEHRVAAPIIDEEANRMKILKEAFDLIDSDGSGKIMPDELGSFFSIQGEDISEDDLVEIMQQIDVDGEIGLEFDEFAEIMKGVDVSDMAVDDIIVKFADKTRKKSRTLQANDPLWKDMTVKPDGIFFRGSGNARMQLAMLIDGTEAQAVVLGLILLDVICIICELLLVATICPCGTYPAASHHGSSYGSSYSSYSSSYGSYGGSYSAYGSHRQLSSGHGECQKGDHEYSNSQHNYHIILHWISISILMVFGAQILALVVIYRLKFFTVRL
jgi:hypothetical protein